MGVTPLSAMKAIYLGPLLLLLVIDGVMSGKSRVGLDRPEHMARLKKQTNQKMAADRLFDFKDDAFCRKAKKVIAQKDMALEKLQDVFRTIQADTNLLALEKEFQLSRFMAFTQEVNETSQMILRSFDWLRDVLHGDYKDIINMRESSLQRLTALRDAALREEQEYNAIITAEEKLKKMNQTKVEGILEEILMDVAVAADQLESDLSEHVFDKAVNKLEQKDDGNSLGDNIETVIRLEGDKDPPNNDNTSAPVAPAGGLIKLVDSQDNQFVLAKGKDSTIPQEDHHFIQDVIYLVLLCFALGWLCQLCCFPAMFGYILGGLILGPSGCNILKSLVQVESLGEFGVFFILFAVGLEFSPEIIRKVLRVAVFSTTGMLLAMVLGGLGIGLTWGVSAKESAFVAACVSLSSTPLVVKFLNSAGDSHDDEGAPEYGGVLLGILVMQDVVLGLLMALLPIMAASTGTDQGTLVYCLITLKVLGALLLVGVVVAVLWRWVIGRLLNFLLGQKNNEMTLLAAISLMFCMLMATNALEISMEVGCFLAGVLISSQGHFVVQQIETLIHPVKDLFACIFFASIGLHVFPSFMAYELTYLTTFTILIVTAKFTISVIVLTVVAPNSSHFVKWVVSAGLAQVSEFSFVLGSRARRLGIISREVYLLILSITTLSLLMAPLLWKMALWQLRIKPKKRRLRESVAPTSPHQSAEHSSVSSCDEEFVVVSPVSLSSPSAEPKRRTLSR